MISSPASAQTPITDNAAVNNSVQSEAPNPSPTDTTLAVPEDRWERVLLLAEDYIGSGQSIAPQTELYKELLYDVRSSAIALRQKRRK